MGFFNNYDKALFPFEWPKRLRKACNMLSDGEIIDALRYLKGRIDLDGLQQVTDINSETTNQITANGFKTTANIDANTHLVVNLGQPVNGSDAANKDYVDAIAGNITDTTARSMATAALSEAEYAAGTASGAESDAQVALSAANAVNSIATQAEADAQSAAYLANSAGATASDAKTSAAKAVDVAQSAESDALSAASVADNASSVAESAEAIAYSALSDAVSTATKLDSSASAGYVLTKTATGDNGVDYDWEAVASGSGFTIKAASAIIGKSAEFFTKGDTTRTAFGAYTTAADTTHVAGLIAGTYITASDTTAYVLENATAAITAGMNFVLYDEAVAVGDAVGVAHAIYIVLPALDTAIATKLYDATGTFPVLQTDLTPSTTYSNAQMWSDTDDIHFKVDTNGILNFDGNNSQIRLGDGTSTNTFTMLSINGKQLPGILMNTATPPLIQGTYNLKATVEATGAATYSWVADATTDA